MAVEQVPEHIAAGVACFKIEGRLKGPEYVAATTAAYRRAIDLARAGQSVRLSQSERHELEQVFSRGLTSGFLEGTQHQVVVAGRSPRHRGVRLGTVSGLEHGAVKVALQGPVKRGDGVVFDAARASEAELGGKVFEVFRERQSLTEEVSEGEVWLTFSNSTRLDGISVGDWVWRNRDEALDAEIRARFEHGIVRRETITASVTGAVGAPLSLKLRDEAGHTATAQSDFVCVAAANRPAAAPLPPRRRQRALPPCGARTRTWPPSSF
jgi:putative protease